MKNVILSLFVIVALIFPTPVALAQNKIENEIFFVASQGELSVGLKEKFFLGGVAVSVNFYSESSPAIREKIKVLIDEIIFRGNRPVFLYGRPFYREIAQKILSKERDLYCVDTDTGWVFILKTSDREGVSVMKKSCTASIALSEEAVRVFILEQWQEMKRSLREGGYEVLDWPFWRDT